MMMLISILTRVGYPWWVFWASAGFLASCTSPPLSLGWAQSSLSQTPHRSEKTRYVFFFNIFLKGFDDLYMSRDPQWQGQVQACVIPEKEISGMWNKICIVLIMNLNLRWFTRMHSAELTQPRELWGGTTSTGEGECNNSGTTNL